MHRQILRALAATAILCAGAGATGRAADLAPDLADPISLRTNMMKQVGASMGAMGAMAKGEAPFEPRVAEVALRAIYAASLGFPAQFPDGTQEGGDTAARPTIWEDRAGFDAAAAGFVTAAEAAVAAKPADLVSLRAVMGEVGKSCRACHEDYRVKKE